MGAAWFDQYADGTDPAAAFLAACDDARSEHGHRYSGTIAEKDDYVIITATPMDPEQAQTLAADLMHRADPRIDDKGGPRALSRYANPSARSPSTGSKGRQPTPGPSTGRRSPTSRRSPASVA